MFTLDLEFSANLSEDVLEGIGPAIVESEEVRLSGRRALEVVQKDNWTIERRFNSIGSLSLRHSCVVICHRRSGCTLVKRIGDDPLSTLRLQYRG